MIWMNNRGYNDNPIRPAGAMIASGVTIAGITDGSTWDVWAGRLRAEPGPDDPADVVNHFPAWNVISYVRTTGTDVMTFDANAFIQDAINNRNNCPTEVRGAPNGAVCVHPNWWVTSVQAGFEIWADGQGLSVDQFSVKPNVDTSIQAAQVDTGWTTDGTQPLIHWAQKFLLRYETTCTTGVSVSIDDNDPATTLVEYDLKLVAPDVDGLGTNLWAVRAGPIYPIHSNPEIPGESTVTFTSDCGDFTQVPVFIDPSGVVVNTLGEPIEGAEVTLWYAPGVASSEPEPDASAFVAVADQDDTIMCPPGDPSGCYGNIDNPTYTDAVGFYRWDVVDGWYKATAEKDGCTSAESPPLPVSDGNPATNVNLVLDCGDGGSSGLLVETFPHASWDTGYCKLVRVTNNTAEPVDWQVTFEVEGSVDYFWNALWSQSGNQVTIEGDNPNWQNILEPGQSTKDIGFCATTTGGSGDPPPGPGDVTVTLTTQSDWDTGYCANVIVTNVGSEPVDWQVTFEVVGTVNTMWNAIWSQSGNHVTAEGQEWNNVLPSGESTHSIGFCATK
jgi:hypothetical protein